MPSTSRQRLVFISSMIGCVPGRVNIACVPYDDSDDSNIGRFGGDDCLRDGLYDDEEVFMAKFVSGGAITKFVWR